VLVQRVALLALIGLILAAGSGIAAPASAERPVKIVAVGDSLMAGYNLPLSAGFPARLERALKAKGFAVEIANAGVSGDTASAGLARIDWSVPDDTDAIIVELGANDMLLGIDPQITRTALEGILRRLAERRIPVLLAGMRAAPNLGADYVQRFEAIYPDLAARFDVVFYPFFLEGVAAEGKLNQRDSIHPTAGGIDEIVARILPKAEELLTRVRAGR
jgi:acyl-CoA thioesterase-1